MIFVLHWQAEKRFQDSVGHRRALQQQIMQLHAKLKEIHASLDKVQRGEERYLSLLTEEYELLREEKRIHADLTDAEQTERESFAALSSAVRESHERERARAERTKYWSIIGSAIGATIGIVGTTVNNYRRMRELKSLVHDSAAGGADLSRMVSELVCETHQQNEEMKTVMTNLNIAAGGSADVALLSTPPSPNLEEIATVLTKNNLNLVNEMTDIKQMIAGMSAGKTVGNNQPSVVYVGPEVQGLLDETEERLESKIRNYAVASSFALYVSSFVTVAVLYMVFSSSPSAS